MTYQFQTWAKISYSDATRNMSNSYSEGNTLLDCSVRLSVQQNEPHHHHCLSESSCHHGALSPDFQSANLKPDCLLLQYLINMQRRAVSGFPCFPQIPNMFWIFDTSSSPRQLVGPQHSQVRAPWPLRRYWSSQIQVAPSRNKAWKETHAALKSNTRNNPKSKHSISWHSKAFYFFTVSVLSLVLARLRNGSALRRSFFGLKRWSSFHLVKFAALITQGIHHLLVIEAPNAQKNWLKIWGVLDSWKQNKNKTATNNSTWPSHHPLAPEVSGSTCKPVIQGQKEPLKKPTLRSLQIFSTSREKSKEKYKKTYRKPVETPYIGDGHPTFNDGILMSWGPIFTPTGISLIFPSPIIWKTMRV